VPQVFIRDGAPIGPAARESPARGSAQSLEANPTILEIAEEAPPACTRAAQTWYDWPCPPSKATLVSEFANSGIRLLAVLTTRFFGTLIGPWVGVPLTVGGLVDSDWPFSLGSRTMLHVTAHRDCLFSRDCRREQRVLEAPNLMGRIRRKALCLRLTSLVEAAAEFGFSVV
jgi:hypothetical protein